jgi:HD-like signal output (HDOD) protein
MAQQLGTSAELEELIESTVSIPTIPTILAEINRVFASADGSAQEAAEIIEKDPAIAAKLLRLVNSSFYALRNPVNSIPLACSILGLKVIRNLVVQATVLDTFSDVPELDSFDPSLLWDHSFKTAVAARELVKRSSASFELDADDAYTCGLVHDVGRLVLLSDQQDNFVEALRYANDRNMPLARAEAEVFGFTHAHVGGLLARHWKLSEKTAAAIMYHHSPGTDAEQWARGFLVHAADTIAHTVTSKELPWNGDPLDDDSMAILGLSEDELNEIRDLASAAEMSF